MVKRIQALFLLFACGLFSQTLQFSSASAPAGDRIVIEMSLQSLTDVEASTLQWEITIPAAQLTFLDKETAAAPAAQAAGKTVSCAVKPSTPPESSAVCMMYGGRESIPNGAAAARLMFKSVPDATLGPTARVQISHALAVSKELKRIPLKDTEAIIKILPK